MPDVTGDELAVNLSYGIAIVFVLAEVGWLRLVGDRDVLTRLATAATMALGAAAVAVGYTAILRRLWAVLHLDATPGLRQTWAPFHGLPSSRSWRWPAST